MKKNKSYTTIKGTVLSPVSDEECQIIKGATLSFENNGGASKILSLKSSFHEELGASPIEEVKAPDGHEWVILPGFVDLHFHWVQDAVRLMPKASLLTWLKDHTWPYEAKFEDPEFSRQMAEAFAFELARYGTLAGACYSSLHPHTVSDALENFRGDFFVGNAIMTAQSPEYLTHSEGEALEGMEQLQQKWGEKYVVTPRFAPTVAGEFLQRLGDFRRDHELFMQTHLSETEEECAFVLELYKKFDDYKDVETYTGLYERAGLLSKKSIFGHAIHLSDEEWRLLAKNESAIAHCPTSNAPVAELGLGSGLFDFKRANKEGVRWALGSDIGGGPFLSMIDVMKSFVDQHRRAGHCEASATMAFYRATLAGARILGLDKRMGTLEVGKDASFILFSRKKSLTPLESAEQFFQETFTQIEGDRRHEAVKSDGSFWRGQKIYLIDNSLK